MLIMIVLLLVVGVGGWLLYKHQEAKASAVASPVTPASTPVVSSSPMDAAMQAAIQAEKDKLSGSKPKS